MSRHYRTRRIPDYRMQEIPEGVWELAGRRVEHILVRAALRESLRDLLTNAYLQGMGDMMDIAMTDAGRLALVPYDNSPIAETV